MVRQQDMRGRIIGSPSERPKQDANGGATKGMVTLPYGQRYVDLKIQRGKGTKIFQTKRVKPISDPTKYVHEKIRRYFAENKDFFLGFEGERACLVVSDNTRYAFNKVVVPILLRQLERINITRRNITILVANGLHAPMSQHDLAENLGEEVVSNFSVENHDPDNELVLLGTTSRGTPILLNEHFMESDLKIATGLTAGHFHAGFGGGCKSILPGISGRISILKNHSFDMVAHQDARYGVCSGNPIYEDIMEAGLMSGLNLIVNTTVDSDRNMTHLFIGEPEETHGKAAEKVAEDVKIEFNEFFDVVVTTNGGYPLDRNLYQCVKGVAIGELMVQKAGTIIMTSECRDGVGLETFQKYMSHGRDTGDVLKKLKKDEPVEGQDNIQILARALARARVIVVTDGVRPEVVRAMKMEHARSVEEALRSCGWPERKELKIAVVPAGPYVLPVGGMQRSDDNTEL